VDTLYDRPTDDVVASVLADHPDVRTSLEVAWRAAWEVVDPVLLELCRLRIAILLDCPVEWAARTPAAVAAGLDENSVGELARWPTSPRFGRRERACLAFTEQFVIDVASLDDASAGAVRDELGEEGLVDFVNALLVVEQRQRLRLIWEQLFGDVS
jgi:alkylhydroperoxidase family enzyme